MGDTLSSAYQTWIAVKESTYGTDAVDAAFTGNENISYLLCNADAEITPMGDTFTPDRARSSQSGVSGSFIQRGSEFTLPVPVVGGDSSNNYRPAYGSIFEMCGFTETTSGSTTVYTLKTSEPASLTLYQYRRNAHSREWRLKRCRGARANLGLEFNVGEEVVAQAAGMGVGYNDYTAARTYFDGDDAPALDADGASLTYTGTASAQSDERLICKGATVTYNSGALPVISGSVDIAMSVALLEQMTSDPTGSIVTRVRDGVSPATGSLTLSLTDDGTGFEDVSAALLSDENATLSIVLEGSSTKVTIELRVQWTSRPAESAGDGIMNFDVEFQVVGDFSTAPFGDNGVKITYEAVA